MIVCIYAGLLALMYVALSFNVILRRVSGRVLFGDNNDPVMTRAVRIHGNFAEFVPLILFLIFAYEDTGGSRYLVHIMGIALIVSRLLHGWGLWFEKIPGRFIGTVITMTLLIVLGVILTIKGFEYMSAISPGV